MASCYLGHSQITGQGPLLSIRGMQTFLPSPDIPTSARMLDYRRLGKQRVEAKQILNAIARSQAGQKAGWVSHPAVLMWKGFEKALRYYHDVMIQEWVSRGYNNNMPLFGTRPSQIQFPTWLGDPRLHASHRANLLRKDFEYYQQHGWSEDPETPYFWPVTNRKKEEKE